jgi:hypothetical protein
MADESAEDEVISDSIAAHRIQDHNVIFDVIIESMNRRFLASSTLYADFACLDPRNFSDLRNQGLRLSALFELSKRLVKFDERAAVENLRCELTSLALHWDNFNTSALYETENLKAREAEPQKRHCRISILPRLAALLNTGYGSYSCG